MVNLRCPVPTAVPCEVVFPNGLTLYCYRYPSQLEVTKQNACHQYDVQRNQHSIGHGNDTALSTMRFLDPFQEPRIVFIYRGV